MFRVVLPGIVKAEQLKNILGTDYVHIQSKAEPVRHSWSGWRSGSEAQAQQEAWPSSGGWLFLWEQSLQEKRKSASLCAVLLLGCMQPVGR